MTQLTGRTMWVVAALAIALLIAQDALAQREGGRRGGRGFGRGGGMMFSPVMLATRGPVQEELKLTDEQKEKIESISDDMRASLEEMRDQEAGPDRREAFEKASNDASAKLAEVLDESQQKRLAGILLQVDLVAGLTQPTVAAELNLTDEQKSKLEEAQATNRRAMRDAFGDLRDASDDERREKMTELRETGDKNILAVLTSEQQAKVEELKGEKVDLPMRGFGGRGRRGAPNN